MPNNVQDILCSIMHNKKTPEGSHKPSVRFNIFGFIKTKQTVQLLRTEVCVLFKRNDVEE